MISIADAKNQLPALIHQAEAGEKITISRRGKPVAVMLSIEQYEKYERLSALNPRTPSEVLDEVRARLEAANAFAEWTDEEVDSWRDRRISEPRCDFSGPEYDWADDERATEMLRKRMDTLFKDKGEGA